MGSSDDRYEKGLDAYASQFGIDRDQVPAWFAERFGARFGTEAINSAGGAWPEDALSLRDRSLIVIAALASQGGVDSRLPGHVRWAIEHGSSREELEALVTLLAVYAGFPRASVAMEIVRAELDLIEREQRELVEEDGDLKRADGLLTLAGHTGTVACSDARPSLRPGLARRLRPAAAGARGQDARALAHGERRV